jgi:hypothetical protein
MKSRSLTPFATVSFRPLTAGDATGFGMTMGVAGVSEGGGE